MCFKYYGGYTCPGKLHQYVYKTYDINNTYYW
jgi:hypothetical protein